MPFSDSESFRRVTVDYAIAGNARIEWALQPTFNDPLPHSFQVQVNVNGGAPGDWENVGEPVIDNCYAIDDDRRLCGKRLDMVYRIELTTICGTYHSGNAQLYGVLSERQWLMVRAIIRRKLLAPTGLEKVPGFLLKRKTHGQPCTCVDPYTGGVTDSTCELCDGTGKVDGFWKAAENTLYDVSPQQEQSHRDNNQTRGTVNDIVVAGQFIAFPTVHSRDVWVAADSDRRYYVRSTRNLTEIMQVPVLVQAELRLAPFSDVIYNIPIE
jgi:hypothetical protein